MKDLFKVASERRGCCGCLWVAASAQQEAQPSSLTLRQAVTIALEKNPLRKAAIADTKVASAEVRAARSFLMPHLNFSETATRGDDPVYVFGSRLRQQRFTEADFTLSQLNTPLPFGNFSTRFGGTGIYSTRSPVGTAITQRKTDERSRRAPVRPFGSGDCLPRGQFLLRRSAGGARQLDVAEQSAKTAHSIMDRSQARFDSGLAVESDLLTAKVRLAARQQELIRARNNLDLARAAAEHRDGYSGRFFVPDYRSPG